MSVFYNPFRLDRDVSHGLPRVPGSPFERVDSNLLAKQVSEGVAELGFRAAAGEPDAVESLYNVAMEATNHLVNLAKRKPEYFRRFASDWPVFPMPISPKDEPKTVNKRVNRRWELLDSLGVAKNLGKTYSNKSRWSLENPATQYAAAMRGCMETNRLLLQLQAKPGRQAGFARERAKFPTLYVEAAQLPDWVSKCATLPEFSKQTCGDWFAVGWQALMDATGGHPESVEELRSLGSYRKGHHATAKPGGKTVEADIRDGLKEKLRRAMRALVP